MEQALKLAYQLIYLHNPNELSIESENFVTSSKLNVFWKSIITGPRKSMMDGDLILKDKINQKVFRKRSRQLSTLFSIPEASKATSLNPKCTMMTLLCAGYRGIREWSTRLLNILLKLEVNANLNKLNSLDSGFITECSGICARSSIFKKYQNSPKTFCKLVCYIMREIIDLS